MAMMGRSQFGKQMKPGLAAKMPMKKTASTLKKAMKAKQKISVKRGFGK